MDGNWNKWWLWLLAPFVAVLWCWDKLHPTPKAQSPAREDGPCE